MLSKTSIRRIHGDIKELAEHPSRNYFASPPYEDNLFIWHFTIRGPPGTEFEDGMYHGRIHLSNDYPFKPPDIVFLTPNGRFSVGAKICLSISAHHPDQWQPAWGVRLMLEALISLLPTESEGAIGGLDWSPRERRKLALQSRNWTCPECGSISELLEKAGEMSDKTGTSKEDEAFTAQAKSLRFHAVDAVDGSNTDAQNTLTSPTTIEKMEEEDEKEEVGEVKEETGIASMLMDSVTEYMDVPRSVSLPTATLQLSRFQLWADKLLSAIAVGKCFVTFTLLRWRLVVSSCKSFQLLN